MSNSQLDDMRHEDHLRWIAGEIGLTLEELKELEPDPVLEPIMVDEIEMGYWLTFSDDADPELLAKVKGLDASRTVRIGLPPEEPDQGDLD